MPATMRRPRGSRARINTELEAARQQIAYAQPGGSRAARPMAELDRFFVAIERWTTAYVDIAKGMQNAPDPQAVFLAAGGATSWQAMFESYADVAPFRPASAAQCPGAPISP